MRAKYDRQARTNVERESIIRDTGGRVESKHSGPDFAILIR